GVNLGHSIPVDDTPPMAPAVAMVFMISQDDAPGDGGDFLPPKEPGFPDDPHVGPPPTEHRVVITAWTRDVHDGYESITLDLKNEDDSVNTFFYVLFGGYRPHEDEEYVAQSETYFAPASWSGTVTFDVPLGDYHRIMFAQVWTGGTKDRPTPLPSDIVAFVPPCPTDYVWPDPYSYDWCVFHYH